MRYVVRALLILTAGYAVMAATSAAGIFPPPLPFALMLIITALGAGVWWRLDHPAELARERHATGLCPACGYNLTANVSGVCPECGRSGRAP